LKQNEIPEGVVKMGLSATSAEPESHLADIAPPLAKHGTPRFFD
jgi:hypothetical protein